MTKAAEMELQRTLGKIESTLASLNAEFSQMRVEQSESKKTLEARVSVLEKWRFYTMGIAATLIFVSRLLFK